MSFELEFIKFVRQDFLTANFLAMKFPAAKLPRTVSTQRDRLYSREAGDLPKGSHTHLCCMKLARVIRVMVWAAVAADGSNSPLKFIFCNVFAATNDCLKPRI